MQIVIKRMVFTEKATIGEMFIDSAVSRECFTLEDMVRTGPKVPGKTAIPAGTYRVVIDMSTRFGREMPHVLDVPGFSGIRIHAGNRPEDTEGCIILGQGKGRDAVNDSKAAVLIFTDKLRKALAAGEAVTLAIG